MRSEAIFMGRKQLFTKMGYTHHAYKNKRKVLVKIVFQNPLKALLMTLEYI